MYMYRKYVFLLEGKAAARRSGGFTLFAACREGQLSVNEATQNTAKIMFGKSNKNSPALLRMLKILPSWPNEFHTLPERVIVKYLKFFLENVKTLEAMCVS